MTGLEELASNWGRCLSLPNNNLMQKTKQNKKTERRVGRVQKTGVYFPIWCPNKHFVVSIMMNSANFQYSAILSNGSELRSEEVFIWLWEIVLLGRIDFINNHFGNKHLGFDGIKKLF